MILYACVCMLLALRNMVSMQLGKHFTFAVYFDHVFAVHLPHSLLNQYMQNRIYLYKL